MLRLERVSVAYAKHVAVHAVSLQARAGCTTVILGANGAGKSTLLKAIGGLHRAAPDSRIVFDGERIDTWPAHRIVDAGIALVPEGRRLFGDLTVQENLLLGCCLPRVRGHEHRLMQRQFELFPRLADRRRQLARTMSGGEQQMLAIARALMSEPRLLLLDEPSLGLSPLMSAELFAILRRLTLAGQSVLMVEQNVRQSLSLADDVYVLENGHVVRRGSAEQMREDASIRQAYLGL